MSVGVSRVRRATRVPPACCTALIFSIPIPPITSAGICKFRDTSVTTWSYGSSVRSNDRGNSATSRDWRATPIDARFGAESEASVTVQQYFPSVTSFPRQIPPRRLPLCSPVSTVLRSHLTSQQRSCQHCPRRSSLAAQGVNRQAALHLRLMGSPAPVIPENAGAFGMSTHAQVLRLRRVRRCLAIDGSDDVAFSLSGQDRHTEVVMSELAGLRYPSHGRSRQTGHTFRPSAEGRSCWLNFLRKILSFSIPNRFYPGTPCPL